MGAFLIWWARQVRDLLSWRAPGWEEGGKGLILAVRTPLNAQAPVVELFSRGRREKSHGVFILSDTVSDKGATALRGALARYERAARTLTLRLPDGVLLERQVVLPLLAERALQQVLDYEMDRLTPFASADLLWSWFVGERDQARGELRLWLGFLPRALLRPLLDRLETAGAIPMRLEGGVGERRHRIVLRPDSPDVIRRRKWALSVAGGACAVLAVTTIVLPFALQSHTRQGVEARFAALSPRVARAEAARRELAARAGGADLFSAEQSRVGDTMEILAALTEIMPDNTFLTELTLQQRKLTLSGQSGAAARLITALSGHRPIWNPVFTAPVTRMESGADIFSIQAEVAP